jgi:hypothetical protein
MTAYINALYNANFDVMEEVSKMSAMANVPETGQAGASLGSGVYKVRLAAKKFPLLSANCSLPPPMLYFRHASPILSPAG